MSVRYVLNTFLLNRERKQKLIARQAYFKQYQASHCWIFYQGEFLLCSKLVETTLAVLGLFLAILVCTPCLPVIFLCP